MFQLILVFWGCCFFASTLAFEGNYSTIDVHDRAHVFYRGTIECENGRVQHFGQSQVDTLYRDDCGMHIYRAYLQVFQGHPYQGDSCEALANIRENGYSLNQGIFELKQFVDRREGKIQVYFLFKNVCEMGEVIRVTDVEVTREEKRRDHFLVYKNGTVSRTIGWKPY